MGIASSTSSTPTPAVPAISLRALASPPRVGSRSTCTPFPTCSLSSSTSGDRVAASLSISTSNSIPSRTAITAIPCRPIGPLTITASPARARSGAGAKPGSSSPIPVVLMNTPSALPRSTTLVSPATIGTPASSAARAIAAMMRSSTSSSRPSSSTNPADM